MSASSPPTPTQAWAVLISNGLLPADPVEIGAERASDLGWTPVGSLPGHWRTLAQAYSRDVGTPHAAVGAACGLQHYCGRLAIAALGVWVQTGTLVDLGAARWSGYFTAAGHTVTVRAEVRTAAVEQPLPVVLDGLREHVRPLADAAQEAGQVTHRLAWGSLATSCAGALARLHRAVIDPARASRLAELSTATLNGLDWGGGRPLVTCRTVRGAYGHRLVHERHTCCLIRLGRDRSVCGTCPQQSAESRRWRVRESADLPSERPITAAFPC